ncbi:hypothetical protein [Nocardioides sp.]|uniref:hypothetical protein n=1 Tax=Nocardioides sp. TaxID=35761 RepID=UPI003563E55E
MSGYYSCMACGYEFDPIATRWFCPHCKFKANCCEGEALAPVSPASSTPSTTPPSD